MSDNLQHQILNTLIELKQDVGEIKGSLKAVQSQILKSEERFCAHSDDNFAHGAKASHKTFEKVKEMFAISLSVVSLLTSLYMARLYTQTYNGINYSTRP